METITLEVSPDQLAIIHRAVLNLGRKQQELLSNNADAFPGYFTDYFEDQLKESLAVISLIEYHIEYHT